MTLPLWISAAWSWLKRNWHWVALPVGVGLWLLGRFGSRKPLVVTSGQLAGQARAEMKADQEAALQRAAADSAYTVALERLEAGYTVEIKNVGQAAQAKADEVGNDPEVVNELLHSVGKDIRGSSKT